MNTRTPWLFEAPLAHELAGGQINPPQQPLVRPGQLIDASSGPDLLNPTQVARAVQQNIRFERAVWPGFYDPISIYYLRYRYMMPTEPEFAQAVARWQSAVGLINIDGIIDPCTWKVMRHGGEPYRYVTPNCIVRPSSFSEVVATFGDPRPTHPPLDKANPHWYRSNVVHAKAPAGFTFRVGSRRPRSVEVHRLLKDQFESLFRTIAAAGLWEAIQPWGGSFNFRNVRQGKGLSMHAFAIAVDINPAAFPRDHNQHFPDPHVVQIFQDYGFHWGIFFPRPDPMHFQFATGA